MRGKTLTNRQQGIIRLKAVAAFREDLRQLLKHVGWDGEEPIETAYARVILALEEVLT